MDDYELGTPEYVIRSVLYGVLAFPERDIPETVTALIEAFRSSGWSIVRTDDHVTREMLETVEAERADYLNQLTDDHVSRKAVEAIREAYVAAAAVPGNNYAKWIIEDLDLILGK